MKNFGSSTNKNTSPSHEKNKAAITYNRGLELFGIFKTNHTIKNGMSKDFETNASQCQLVVIENRLIKPSTPNKINQLCLRILVSLSEPMQNA